MEYVEPRDTSRDGNAYGEEHLVTSDKGIIMQRRLLEKQIDVVAGRGDPIGISFDPAQALVKVRSGNFFRATATS